MKKKLKQIDIPVIFDEDRLIFRCENCGYIVECNFKDMVDLKDFLECVLAHKCYVSRRNNGMD